MPKILIADDSIAVRKVAERLLTEAGMVVSLAANGTEALTFLGQDCPDLIVSDVIMPDKSGYEVCSFVRAQPHLSAIPVLLISGIVNDDVTRQADACKADGVLKKPFQGTSLKDRVQELLAKRAVPLPAGQAVATETLHKAASGPPLDSAAPLHAASPAGPPATPTRAPASAATPMNPVPPDSAARHIDEATPQKEGTACLGESDATLAGERERPAPFKAQLPEADSLAQRVRELEATLVQERAEREQHQRTQAAALEEVRAHNEHLTARLAELTTMLADERRRGTDLAEKASDIDRLTARLESAESRLVAEREAMQALSHKAAEDARKAARVIELEATLSAERDAAAQLVQQMTAMEQLEQRVKDLEARLATEQSRAAQQLQTMAVLEEETRRIRELDAALTKERERTADFEAALSSQRQQAAILAEQVRELERATIRVQELDEVLAGERERSTQLAKRATDAEHVAEQSSRRLEEMTKKLAEIVSLASQISSGTL